MKINHFDPWVSLAAASALSGRSRYQLLTLIASGTLTGERFGGRICVRRMEVESLPPTTANARAPRQDAVAVQITKNREAPKARTPR
jgi:hypothetical protein